MHDFQRAMNVNEHSQRANEGYRRAQKLEKQSKKRNYYAILGVKRYVSVILYLNSFFNNTLGNLFPPYPQTYINNL